MSDELPLRQRAPLLLEPEAGAPAVIEAEWAPAALAPVRRRGGAWRWLLGGAGLLLASWAGLAGFSFVQDLFARSEALGWLGVAGFGLGLGMLGVGGLAESRAYRGLARVERLRGVLAGPGGLGVKRAAALAWIETVAAGLPDATVARAAVVAAGDEAGLEAALRAQVGAPLAAAAGRIGRQAAVEGAALVAVLPHPALDALFAGLRGLRVIRQVAGLYGMRPGVAMEIALARRVAWTAAGTAGADLLAQGMLDQVLSAAPGIRHVVSGIPGAGVAAVRLYRLARVTGAACDPLAR